MAVISTSGISALQVIKSDHVLRIINALNGTVSNDIIISGSLSNGIGITVANNSHAEGSYTQATGNYSHTEGSETRASGEYSHAEGYTFQGTAYDEFTQATGQGSHAEGRGTWAKGDGSHAEGTSTDNGLDEDYILIASGAFSHAEGASTVSQGAYSHAEGWFTKTIGNASHAEGNNTVALGNYQHVQGQFNISSSDTSAFIHGNGTSTTNRSNLIFASGSEVQVTGSFRITGSAYLGSTVQSGNATIGGIKPTVIIGEDNGGVLDIRSSSGSVNTGQKLGTIQFTGKDDASNGYTMAKIEAITDVSPGTGTIGASTLKFHTSNFSSPIERMSISPSGVVSVTGSLKITGSFVPPVMTSASRAALVAPATGSIVYQNDSVTGLYVYKGSSWVNLTSSEIYTFLHGSISPTTNNTYYIGNFPDTASPTSNTDIRGKVIAQHTGLITSAVIAQYSGTNSSTEVSATASLSIWNINTGISSSITDKLYYTASSIASYTLASPLTVTEGDILSVKWVTPSSWSSPPSSSRHRVTIKTSVTN